MRSIVFVLLGFVFVACSDNRQKNISGLVNEWMGKEIKFPERISFTCLGQDTEYEWEVPYKIVSYIDSAGCTNCKMQLGQWKRFIPSLDSTNNTSVVFFIHPKNKQEIDYLLRIDNFTHPVCIDIEDSLNKLNHFPSDMTFQTFLLDKDNKVLAIGNPIHNPKVKELYLKIIQGKKVGREDGSKQIVTQASIDRTIVSLGSFGWQEEQKATFTLKNTGDKPLVIEDITTSCGCTTVAYSQEPVQPGRETTLEVAYKAEHPGHFDKTVTVYCNTEDSPLRLKISGDAIDAEVKTK